MFVRVVGACFFFRDAIFVLFMRLFDHGMSLEESYWFSALWFVFVVA